jgi:hypothetical protein
MSAYTEYGRNGETWMLYKIWGGRLWYYAGKQRGKGKLADKILWTDDEREAKTLSHGTASGYAKTLSQPQSQINGAIGIMPYHQPATEPTEG